MKLSDFNLPKEAFIYSAIHLLSNRMQTIGDKLDPAISSKQWFLLAAVAQFTASPPNISTIAGGLGTSRQNIKKMAEKLESRGYVRLEKDKNDSRSILLYLTEQCHSYFKSREQIENEYLEKIFAGIDENMLSVLCKGMSMCIDNMDNLLQQGDDAE